MRGEEVFLFVILMAGMTWLLTPLVRALAERIRPRPQVLSDPGVDVVRDELLMELNNVRREVAELGDRLDFAERLLAKQREGDRLAPPQLPR